MTKVEVADRAKAKQLARRVEALEKDVAECKRQLDQLVPSLAGQPPAKAW